MSPRSTGAGQARRVARALRRRLDRSRSRPVVGGVRTVPVPAGRPAATYARVLDGEHLWLALAGVDAAAVPGLRLDDGTTLALEVEVAEPLPGGGGSFRCPLPDALLPADARPGETGTAALVVTGSSGAAQPVVDATAPDEGPTRTPPSRSGDRQHTLGRGADGTLLLTATRLAPRAVVLGFGGPVPDPDALVVDVALPPGCPPVVDAALDPLDGSEPSPASWEPLSSVHGRVRVGTAAVVPPTGARLVLRGARPADGRTGDDLAVHRARDGLRDPATGVALPHPLVDDRGATLRWTFGAGGALVVRRAEATP